MIDGAINWGVIVGTLDDTTDQALGTIVPEPATAWQLAIAVAAALGVARRLRMRCIG